jgi:hypothetical protein
MRYLRARFTVAVVLAIAIVWPIIADAASHGSIQHAATRPVPMGQDPLSVEFSWHKFWEWVGGGALTVAGGVAAGLGGPVGGYVGGLAGAVQIEIIKDALAMWQPINPNAGPGSDRQPSFAALPYPQLCDSSCDVLLAIQSSVPYHITPTGSPALVTLGQRANDFADRSAYLAAHYMDSRDAYIKALAECASALEAFAEAYDAADLEYTVSQANIQAFEDSCATGHLPSYEDQAWANAGLTPTQRGALANYFSSSFFAINLSTPSVSVSTILHEEARRMMAQAVPATSAWGVGVLALALVLAGAAGIGWLRINATGAVNGT